MSRRSSTRRRALVCASAIAAVATVAAAPPALAVNYTWNAASGTFQNGANWSSSLPGTYPDSSADDANFTSGSAGITVSFNAPVTNNSAFVNLDIIFFDLNTHTYTLTEATLGDSSLLVGNTQYGELWIREGTVSGVTATVGLSTAGTGLVTVQDTGILSLTGRLVVGSNGDGTFDVTGGGVIHGGITVGGFPTATGTMSVSGSTSSALGSGSVIVGSSGGVGSLLIENGGDASGTTCTLGSSIGGDGTITVIGAGSTFSLSSSLTVGSAGEGTLEVRNGAAMNSSAGGMFVGNSFGGTGDVTVSGAGATLTSTGATSTIGNSGAATVRIQNGGIISTSAVNFGGSASGSATVTLSGSGSTWNAAGNVSVGGSGLTPGGTATVNIGTDTTFVQSGSVSEFRILGPGTVNINGGTLSANTLSVTGGALNFNSGTLNLTGSGTQLTIGSGGLFGSTLVLDGTRQVNVTSTTQITSAGLLVLDGGTLSSSIVSNAGEIQLTGVGATLSAVVLNDGRVLGNGRIRFGVTNNAAGELRAAAPGERLFIASTSSSTNNGTINALNGGTVDFAAGLNNNAQVTLAAGTLKTGGPLNNGPTGRVSGRGTILAGSIQNGGDVILSAGVSDVVGAISNAAGSELVVTGGGTATFHSNINSLAGAIIRVSDNSTAVFLGNVTGPATYQGSGTKIFEGGFSATGALATPGSTIVEGSSSLTASHIREALLTVAGQVVIEPNGTATGTSRVGQLVVSVGGRLDLTDNKLIVISGDVGTSNGSIYSGLTGLIQSAQNAGTWDGGGITTSIPDAQAGLTSLGIANADQTGYAGGTFAGVGVSASDVLVMYTYAGDANLDGLISGDDYGAIDQNVAISGAAGWYNGDFNYDGIISGDDYAAIDSNFVAQGAPFPTGAAAVSGVIGVPEPVGGAWLVAAAAVTMRRVGRKRR